MPKVVSNHQQGGFDIFNLRLQLEVWLGEKFQNFGKTSKLFIDFTTFCERMLGKTPCPWLFEYFPRLIQEFVATINMDINFKCYI